MNSMFQGTSKRAPSDGRNESSGYAGKKAPPEKDETTLPMARATAALSAPAGSSLVGHSITVPNASIGTSGASLPLPARLKEATSEDSMVQNASSVNSDSASHEEEMDLGGGGETTPSNPPEEGQHNDLLKHIRQRNALYSRRKYYKRKQELERLEEMKHQLEVRNEALRRDNVQLERWMQLVQQQIPRERNNASSVSRQALLQRLLEQASSQPPSQYSTTAAAAAAAVANRPVTFTGVHDRSSLRALELQQLLRSTGSSSSMQDLLLPSAVRSNGLTPSFAAPPIDMRRLLASQRMTPPAAHLGELSNVPMDVPSTLSHLLSRNPSSSILQRTTPASLLPSQQQQLLTSLRDQNTAAFIDQARREDEEQLLLLQLLQQQQPIDPNSVLLGPLSTRSALTSQDVLLQLLQNKQREEQALLRQWSSSSSQEDLLWQLQKQRSLPPPKGPPPPH
jgi:hypothetical protein